MRYYKQAENGYILSIGTGAGEEEITQDEYENILSVIRSCPTAEVGYGYKLRTDLTWELVEVPVIPEDEQEITDEEALNIILGGEA